VPPSLTPEERAALAEIEQATEREDPRFARRLRRSAADRTAGWAPRTWPSWLYLATGLAFLAGGLILEVGSATALGLVLLLTVALRSASTRANLLRAASWLFRER
jgi:hypothetical protein